MYEVSLPGPNSKLRQRTGRVRVRRVRLVSGTADTTQRGTRKILHRRTTTTTTLSPSDRETTASRSRDLHHRPRPRPRRGCAHAQVCTVHSRVINRLHTAVYVRTHDTQLRLFLAAATGPGRGVILRRRLGVRVMTPHT